MVKLIQSTNNLTVLILAAGYGRRMGPFSRMVNKSLIPYDNKPLISHILEKFPITTKFVIACGNLGQQVKDYVSTVHSEKHVIFVDIPVFNEGETGPATTICYCKDFLPWAFLWISCDTLFEFNYADKLDHNWIAVHPVDSNVAKDYCWIERNGNEIVSVKNKEESKIAVDAFIGLMYVRDNQYIDNLVNASAREVFEGFDGLDLKAYTVSKWQDFGTYEKWQQISEGLPEVSFPKPDEIFYQDNGKIIKFTTDPMLATLRHKRANINSACMPAEVSSKSQFLFYNEEDGDTLYNCLTEKTFTDFLKWANNSVWITGLSDNMFSIADSFYRKKTLERLAKFRIKYSSWVEPSIVNGHTTKSIEEYIADIDFTWLASETKWAFIHGDMQFDNIIYNQRTERFTAIDWRTDFAGDLFGDMYYDLAKMLGGLYLSYKYVKEDLFSYTEHNNQVTIKIPSVDNVTAYESILHAWVIDKGYNWQKVRTLVPIIYLNMAPLHEAPFDKFLIALAQLEFSKL